jgi:putative toxin-antitoxin system antitoxin component (TIGR02293 family)
MYRDWSWYSPNRALADQTPFSMLDTEQGAQIVLDVLGRLEHGVFS